MHLKPSNSGKPSESPDEVSNRCLELLTVKTKTPFTPAITPKKLCRISNSQLCNTPLVETPQVAWCVDKVALMLLLVWTELK